MSSQANSTMAAKQIPGARPRVLVVEGDQARGRQLEHVLTQCGYETFAVRLVEDARAATENREFIGVIWCVRRMEPQSLMHVQLLKGHLWGVPLLALVGSGSGEERCALLEAGAEACIDGACGDREVVASLGALTRMVSSLTTLDVFEGRFLLDSRERRLHRLSCSPVASVFLPPHEFLLFRLLASSPLRTVSYAVIDHCIWGRNMSGNEATRRKLVDRLRVALATVGGLNLLTDHGRGIRLECAVP